MTRRCDSYQAFWPYYLGEHAKPGTRRLHLMGTGLGLCLLIAAIALTNWWLALAALLAGYGFAWAGHALIEKNRPATFDHPLWSFISDLRLFFLWVAGQLDKALEKHGISKES